MNRSAAPTTIQNNSTHHGPRIEESQLVYCVAKFRFANFSDLQPPFTNSDHHHPPTTLLSDKISILFYSPLCKWIFWLSYCLALSLGSEDPIENHTTRRGDRWSFRVAAANWPTTQDERFVVIYVIVLIFSCFFDYFAICKCPSLMLQIFFSLSLSAWISFYTTD